MIATAIGLCVLVGHASRKMDASRDATVTAAPTCSLHDTSPLKWHTYTYSFFQMTSLPDNNINHDVHCHQPQGIVDNQLDCPACASAVASTLDSNHNVRIPVYELHDFLHVPHEAPAMNGTSGRLNKRKNAFQRS
jgi:hypothetical protein